MVDGAASEDLAALILRVRSLGSTLPGLIEALDAVPRDRFLPTDQIAAGWKPWSVPLPCGQSMHPPELTIRLVHALQPHPSLATLEVGTGSGFQTALLSKLSKKVHTIDRYKTLIERAGRELKEMSVTNVTLAQADGLAEAGDNGTYDRIIVDSSFSELPRHLLERLAPGGVVVTAIGEPGKEQMAVELTKVGNRFERQDLFPVHFSPLEPGLAQAL